MTRAHATGKSLPHHQDLARSGLTSADAKKLGVSPLEPTQVKALTGHAVPAYKIPYFSPDGRKLDFYRLRFTAPPTKFGRQDKPQRYWQPVNTMPRAYFAPLGVRWTDVLADTEKAIYLTEGEKKSARTCKEGLPCIGLGGVWSWRAKRAGVALISDLADINWTGRTAVIVFDSDVSEKTEVQAAMSELARQLLPLGAVITCVKLPAPPGTKVGLDDYFESGKTAEDLRALPQESLLGGLADELRRLNGELAYVKSLNAVWIAETRQLISSEQKLVKLAMANREIAVLVDAKLRKVNTVAEWLKWPYRREHAGITYAPGAGPVTDDNQINIWSGWGTAPVRGDVALWRRLLDHLFAREPEHREWFEQWCAYPIQHPGAKLTTAVVLHSRGTGIGKSLVGLTLGRIYGKNFSEITQEHLHTDFNDWVAGKQFVLGDDVTGSDKRRDADMLKVLITRSTVRVNVKYQPAYAVDDHANYMLTTNQPDGAYLEDDDRRFFILEVPDEPLPPEFYKAYDAWFKSPAVAALHDHLLNHVNCASFEPYGRAPVTAAKSAMIDVGRSDVDAWAHLLRRHPDAVLRLDDKIIKRELLTVDELRKFYDPDGAKRAYVATIAKALRRAGFRPPKLITISSHETTMRVVAVRNVERWANATHHEYLTQLVKERFGGDSKGAVVPLRPARAKKF